MTSYPILEIVSMVPFLGIMFFGLFKKKRKDGLKLITIKKGKHSSNIRFSKFSFRPVQELYFEVEFNRDYWYPWVNARGEDQKDQNKLAGIAFGWPKYVRGKGWIHWNCVRFTTLPDWSREGYIRVFAYQRLEGNLNHSLMGKQILRVGVGKKIRGKIRLQGDGKVWLRLENDRGEMLAQESLTGFTPFTKYSIFYTLDGYFGGDLKAPQKITYWFKQKLLK